MRRFQGEREYCRELAKEALLCFGLFRWKLRGSPNRGPTCLASMAMILYVMLLFSALLEGFHSI